MIKNASRLRDLMKTPLYFVSKIVYYSQVLFLSPSPVQSAHEWSPALWELSSQLGESPVPPRDWEVTSTLPVT